MGKIERILLNQIDDSDDTFSTNFQPDLRRLRASIEEVGLIQPVILRKKEEGYQIISGFRRISILSALGVSAIESQVFEGSNWDGLKLFNMSLHENLTTRGFNTAEIAIALNKLIHIFHVGRDRVRNHFLPLFSLEPNEKILDTYLSLARMENEVKKYVVEEKVSRSNIRKLSLFKPEDRLAFISFAIRLKLGESRLREMLSFVEEICRRDRSTVGEVVRKPEIESVLSHRELTPSQKTEHVKKGLLQLRYPRMKEMEKEFEEKRKTLNLPAGVNLNPPPFFEGKGMKAEFQFETVEEYQAILSSLLHLVSKREFEELVRGKGGAPHPNHQIPNKFE